MAVRTLVTVMPVHTPLLTAARLVVVSVANKTN